MAQTERSFYGDPPLFDQATFGLEQKLKMGDGFDRAASKDKGRVVYGT